MRIEYDPGVISYEELLDVFWDSHNPFYEAMSTQYRSRIFYHNEEQRQIAEASKQRAEAENGREIVTEILPAGEFYLAEDYHQKYYMRGNSHLAAEMTAIYPDINDLVASTAAARINGYLGGYGTIGELEAQVDQLGLSADGQQRLLDAASKRISGTICGLR